MIVFRNPGLIDMDAVRTMGVSVKRPGSFGYFGTGIKFAIANVLRGGGSVQLWRGVQKYTFSTIGKEIRGQEFQIVQMEAWTGTGSRSRHSVETLGFTTDLGKNWEPWMVLREFGCNALDEGGGFDTHEEAISLDGDHTTLVVEWPALDEVWAERQTVFCHEGGSECIHHSTEVQVLEGQSDYVFYRGVRAHKLQKPSVVTYNILSEQQLSEDRNIAYFYYPMGEIRKLWLECNDHELLMRVLCPEGDVFEKTINYAETTREPSRAFLDAVLDARLDRGMKERLNTSARDLLHRHLRSEKEAGVGYYSGRYMKDEFGVFMSSIGEIFSEDELKLDDVPLVLVEDEDVREGALAMLESGRVYISRSLLKKGRREIAETVLPLILELRADDVNSLIQMIVPTLLRFHPDLARENRTINAAVEDADDSGVLEPFDEETSPGGARDPRLAEGEVLF